MRLIHSIAAAALLLTAGAPAIARLSPEAELAKEIAGRVEGKPVNCINLSNVRGTRIIEKTAIVYDTGSTIYVNRPRGGADLLDRWDVLVTKLHSSQLCTPEIVQLYDNGSRMQSGFVSLGEFVPYKKVKAAKRD